MSSSLYRNGSRSRIFVAASAADTTTVVPLACRAIKIDRDPGLWDTSNADDGGFFRQGRGQKKCTGSFEILHRTNDTSEPVEEGQEYFARLYTDGSALPYRGTIIIGKCGTAPNIQGELVTTVEFGFQGVYDSPTYQTAIADFTAKTGRFADGYLSTAAPTAGGANGVTRTGGVTNANTGT